MLITAIGEALIDFTPVGRTENGVPLLAQNPGGGVSNVLTCVAKLGHQAAFIGMVGGDAFGDFLERSLQSYGVDTSGLVRTQSVATTLAFVHLDETGDRSFHFLRSPGADQMLTAAQIHWPLIHACDLYHFSAVTLSKDPACTAIFQSLETAKALGKIISFDPNYRSILWDSPQQAAARLNKAAAFADILKVSEEELLLMTGQEDLRQGARTLLGLGCSVVFVTKGPLGAYAATAQVEAELPAFAVTVADTTGAGDCFMGAVLCRLCGASRAQLQALSQPELRETLRFAVAAGSLATTRHGGMSAVPSLEEINQLM